MTIEPGPTAPGPETTPAHDQMVVTIKVVWKDPPPPRPRGRESMWPGLLDPLKEHPGRWALVRENIAPSGITPVRKKYPDFEFRSSTNGYGRVDLYARYLGPKTTH